MNETVITWSFENWITIFLMCLAGFVVLSFVHRKVRGTPASE